MLIWPFEWMLIYSLYFKNTYYFIELLKDYFTGIYAWPAYENEIKIFRLTHYRFLFALLHDIAFYLMVYYEKFVIHDE